MFEKVSSNKLSREEFMSLSVIDRRQYVIQKKQEENLWWGTTFYKIGVIGFFISLVLFGFFLSQTTH